MVEWFENFLGAVNDVVWGPPMLILIVGTGIFLTFRLAFLQFRTLPYSLKLAFSRRAQDKKSPGDISHFQALTTALAATIGIGNIAGVATAVVLGGPGAVFWMWISALFGMATKYAEAILAVKYRVQGKNGEFSGGPMYYIEKGLKLKWLAVLFAVFGAIAAFGIGNVVQSNEVSSALNSTFNVPTWITGIVLTVLAGLVILGGIKKIGKVTAYIVPFMALFYVGAGLVIIVTNFNLVPAAVNLIFTEAFTGSAIIGGGIGAAIRYGVARGVFSNEAGLGSAPIAAAAARTDYPGRQALVSMTQVFIDTIVVCSITGIAIVMGNIYMDGLNGASLTSQTFELFLGSTGSTIVTIGLTFFAFSTILGWSYYGEKCFNYLFKEESTKYYRILFVLLIFAGALGSNDIIWNFADAANAMMAVPNLIGLLGLSGIVVAETNRFLKVAKAEKAAKSSDPPAVNE
ncbi:alanine/glycine:cation symporter family protein [Evansella cellulosilytica]|uniref:Amino acid carrier protein n=1 Tax=Evansella cellulosilytica (strain ATCC 21833 / DSM 2522 / FERM P-1141 / JCM 9156 / N-4) TaxID=649639 RepID=E6TY64_EVAC2|nr:sodium:alanine symporter family protein [Evansella cellulosilytica]ADU32383.1 amino acid carrier protein [Evansella cellulosilytica DSM 2522]